MGRRVFTAAAAAVIGSLALADPAAAALPIARKGVSFFYLSNSSETFPWVLDKIGPTPGGEDPTVLKKLNALFDTYRAAGVNDVRILVGPGMEPAYPVPSAALVGKVNNFMRLAKNKNLGIEFLTDGQKDSSGYPEFMFIQPWPYTNDKIWIRNWMQRLDFSLGNLNVIMISGDSTPCEVVDASGTITCYGDTTALTPGTRSYNNGRWLATMWAWFTDPSEGWWPVNASFDAHTLDYTNGTTPAGLARYAQWVDTYTPTVPFIGTPFYYYLPPGATAAQYRARTMQILNAYHAATSKPLSIDEYGMHMGNGWTWKDQLAWYQGYFDAVACGSPHLYQMFSWIAGNDFPALAQCNFYGMFSEVTCGGDCDNAPQTCYYVWQGRPAWDVLADYYTRTACLATGAVEDATAGAIPDASAIPQATVKPDFEQCHPLQAPRPRGHR